MVGTELVIVGVFECSGVLADGLVADQQKPEALSEHEPRFLELAAEDPGVGALGPTEQP